MVKKRTADIGAGGDNTMMCQWLGYGEGLGQALLMLHFHQKPRDEKLCALSAGGESDLEDVALAPLRDTERFGIVRRLLATADINLERRQSAVRAVTCKVPNLSPLVLYPSINSLGCLPVPLLMSPGTCSHLLSLSTTWCARCEACPAREQQWLERNVLRGTGFSPHYPLLLPALKILMNANEASNPFITSGK
ncbi:Non-syndromic hearing impairment protein 5 like protein [Myotis brandtii]|uniref:Non-syndromic hearing impairment protein 5 like protein n=1 Tax=Myotis brandtii TaxID=109478 RepID=S7N385_MYOBR|nr:Non-syndromic hearing impairment protein 5 like protein [Myotis brandtii]